MSHNEGEYADIIRSGLDQQEAPLRASMLEAAKTTPDRAAEIHKLSNQTLLPPSIVERNYDLIRQRAIVEDNDYGRIIRETPHLANWLSDPQNAAVSRDDLHSLGFIERALDVGRSIVGGAVESAGSTIAGFGDLGNVAGRALRRHMEGGPSFPDVPGALDEFGKSIESVGTGIEPPPERQNTLTQVGSGLGQLIPVMAASMVLGPEAAGAMFAGQGARGISRRAEQSGQSGTPAADLGILGGAAVGVAIGKARLGELLQRIPPSLRSPVAAVLLDLGMSGTEQAAIMGVQTVLNNAVAKLAIDPNTELTAGLIQDASIGGLTGVAARMILGAAGLRGKYQRAVASQRSENFFKALGEGVKDSKTFQRLPEKLQELVLNMTKDGPIENVYIPADEARQYFQDKKIDPAEVLGTEGAAGLQQGTGEDVKVPMREYATRIAATEHAGFFNEIARLGDPEAMNAREGRAFAEEIKAARPQTAPASSQVEQSAGKVREDIVGQLTGTGFQPSAVDAYAKLYENTFRTIGERAGVDPFELYENYRLKITRPLPEVLAKLPDTDTRLDSFIDQLRAGKKPEAADMFGKSLVDFIRENGGVKDEGGDLASREVDNERKPFQKRIINNETGVPADTAREKAAEAGYLDKQSSINDFLDAIDKEVRGEPVYAQQNQNPQAIEQSIVLDQLDSYLKSKDIDVAKASNAEIKAALKEAARSPDIDARTGTVFSQDYDLEQRGRIVFGDNRHFNIELLEKADPSTFLHETGHFYLEVFGDLVDELKTRPGELNDTQQRMVADYDKLLENLGVDSREKIGRDQHEQFARSFEAYLREGKAPSPEMRSIFQRFKGWLVNIYRSLKQLNVNLNPETTAIFDRLLASDEEIERAKSDAQIRSMIEDQGQAERLGLSREEFNAYAETVRKARDQAKDALDQEYMDEYNQSQSDWYQARRNEARQKVASEVHGQRDYMVLSFLKDGTLPDGSPLPDGVQGQKLDAGALEERYGKHKESTVMQQLRKLDLYRREGGIDPDQAAQEFNYSSGDEMVQALLKLRPMNELIDAETTDRMRQTYGDMLTDGTAAEKARDAVMTEGRSKVIEAEMKALAKKIRETAPFRSLGATEAKRADRAKRTAGLDEIRRFVPSRALAADIANGRIADMKVRDVKPGSYYAAARREGNLALEAVNRGDFQEALKHKQQELVSVEMYRAATDTGKAVEKIRDYMRGFDKADKRGRIGKAGADYLEQIDKLRERFEFSRQTNKALDQRQSLKAFMDAELAKGHELDIPPDIQNEARQQNYRDMTVGELRGLNDAVKSIEHWANFKNKLLRNQAKRELDQLGADGVASLDGNSRGPRKTSLEMRLPGGEKGRKLESFFLSHLPLGSILREMDGFKDGGFLFENVMRPIDEAGNAEAVRLEGATKAVMDLYGNAYKGEETSLWEKSFVPEINDSLTKWGRLMVALNWGNEGNRQRVQSGFGWNEGQVKAILDTLDERDWKFVQGVWDHINSYAPEIAAKQKRVTGVSPDMVDATPVPTKFGEFKGGYFPIVYENRLTARAAGNEGASFAKLIEQASYTKATTARGHTEARLKNVSMPLRLDPGVITEHLQQVIHDLTHHEMLIDVGRLLGRKDIQDGIYRNYGDVAWKEIQSHIRDIALGSTPSPSWYRTFSAIRSNAVSARLGWNMVTAMVHIPNITSGMVRVGPKWVMKGVVDSLSSAKGAEHSAQWVAEQSDMMRLRWKHRMVELSEFRDQIGLNRGKLSSEIHDAAEKIGISPEVVHRFKDSYLMTIHRILQFAEIPTWVGAYEKAVNSGAEPSDARAQADRAILDSIGGGQIKDQAAVQKSGIGKIFTTFMTYGLSMHRLGREVVLKDQGGMRKAMDASLLVLLPTAFITGVHYYTRRHKKDETFAGQYKDELIDHALGSFVGLREFQGAGRSPEYSGPAAFGMFGTGKKFIFQAEHGKTAALKTGNELAGELFGYPAYQVDKSIEGTLSIYEGKTKNPSAVLFGPPSNK